MKLIMKTKLTSILIGLACVCALSASAGTFTLATNLSASASTTNTVTKNASAKLTFVTNAVAGETVTVGSTTYTFVSAITNTAGAVLVGADIATSITNLAAAINAGTGSGTLYGSNTVANPDATATFTTTNLTATASKAGPDGNKVAVSETVAGASWPVQWRFLAGGSSAAKSINPVNGLGLNVTVSGITNAWTVVAAVSVMGNDFATTGNGVIAVSGTGAQTVFTNVPASAIGNSKFVALIKTSNTDTNSAAKFTITGSDGQ